MNKKSKSKKNISFAIKYFINEKKIPIIVLIIINKELTNNEIKIIITKEGRYSPPMMTMIAVIKIMILVIDAMVL